MALQSIHQQIPASKMAHIHHRQFFCPDQRHRTQAKRCLVSPYAVTGSSNSISGMNPPSVSHYPAQVGSHDVDNIGASDRLMPSSPAKLIFTRRWRPPPAGSKTRHAVCGYGPKVSCSELWVGGEIRINSGMKCLDQRPCLAVESPLPRVIISESEGKEGQPARRGLFVGSQTFWLSHQPLVSPLSS